MHGLQIRFNDSKSMDYKIYVILGGGGGPLSLFTFFYGLLLL
jgi:hypothetical protein